MPSVATLLLAGLLSQADGMQLLEGEFTISNNTDAPLCISASVLNSGPTLGQFDLLSPNGEITQVYRIPSVVAEEPPLPENWLVIPVSGEMRFARRVLVTERDAGHVAPAAVRIPYYTLPCDFVLNTFVHRNPASDSESEYAIDAQADRLAEYKMTDWTSVSVSNQQNRH